MGTSEEPHFYSDLDLARRLERAEAHSNARFVEARARVFPQSGACWIEVAGTYAMFDGPASPVTQTFGLGLFQTVTIIELKEIEDFYRERSAPVFHEVSPLAGLSVVTLLNEQGYQPVELTSVMYRPIRQGIHFKLPLNERIRARPIGEDEQELWAQITAKGWGEFAEFSDFLPELGQINRHRKDALSFLAELDGQPIAAGVLTISAGVALLAGSCTIPEGRKQGAQLALLESRLRYAAEQGCDIAMICTQPGSDSQRNAERHGFRIAYTRIKWRLADRVF
jgi:GNAT superfamily N-acetyltransferase